jgi:hypothetical protein
LDPKAHDQVLDRTGFSGKDDTLRNGWPDPFHADQIRHASPAGELFEGQARLAGKFLTLMGQGKTLQEIICGMEIVPYESVTGLRRNARELLQ